MEDDPDGSTTPFWLQSTNTFRQADSHRRRSPSDLFLNSTFLIVILLVSAVLFIFFIIPSLLSFTSQIFKPNSVKKSWDSLNLVLVLFAIICGFLSRTNSDNTSSHEEQYGSSSSQEVERSNRSTTTQWYEYSDRTIENNSFGRMRSSSSYPNLRNESPWMNGEDRWRFLDDTQVNSYPFSDTDNDDLHRRRRRREVEVEDSSTNSIAVDTFFNRPREVSNSPLRRSSPPPPPEPAPDTPALPLPRTTVKRKATRTSESLARREKSDNSDVKLEKLETSPTEAPAPVSTTAKRKAKQTSEALAHREKSENSDVKLEKLEPPPTAVPAPAPAPAPTTAKRKTKRTAEVLAHREKSENNDVKLEKLETPPPAPEVPQHSEERSGKSDRKRGGATKDFLTSLYHPGKKKKKQRQRSMENLDSFLQPPPSQPQPPPPPPPPPSVFQNLFSSKKGKAKKIDSVQPPPPPPPPPRTATKSKAKIQIALEQQSQANLVTNRKPPLPAKTSSFNSVEENLNSGSQSPMNSIPPPPPLPPFKMQDWKFPVHGDYVRIKSNNSSRSGSPDSDDAGPSSIQSTSTMSAMDGGGSPPPMFYASPDVDTKADTFIARFKAGLQLEKMNSIKKKQGMGLSNLGPERSPSPGTTEGPGPRQI